MIKSGSVTMLLTFTKWYCEVCSSTVSSMKAVCFDASGVDAVSSPELELVWS